MLLILAASPHANGLTDALATVAANAARKRGNKAGIVFLRDYAVAPCLGCKTCGLGGKCVLEDDADKLFAELGRASALLVCAPIYFYALPAQFKALIDRSQRYWQPGQKFESALKKAGIILTSGRQKGQKLFCGALLTLRYFLLPFDFAIAAKLCCPGADELGVEEARLYHEQAASLGEILC